ncbi:MAG: hypothetical protein WCO65_00405 [bacterium]
MLYLIGVQHGLQYVGIGSAEYEHISRFKKYLSTQCKKIKPKYIAEEFNDDALKKRCATSNITTCKEISEKFNIQHIFIEPTLEERKVLNIPTNKEIHEKLGIKLNFFNQKEAELISHEENKYFPIREKFWLSKIPKKDSGLVIIGASHIETFKSLLESQKIPFSILDSKWDI